MAGKKMNRWLRAIRAPGFLTVSVIPVLLATAMAWHDGYFHPGYFALTILGAILVHCGANSGNEVYDYLSGNDGINTARTPFSGGSGVLVERELSAAMVLRLSLLLFAVAGGIGVYLAIVRGPAVMALVLTGIAVGYAYTAPPLRLVYRGLGELAVGFCFGPLLVAGAYFVQTQRLDWVVVVASVPVGLLTVAILYVNEFPDYVADRAAAKRTLIVRIGPARAVWGYYGLLALTYLSVVLAVGAGLMPRLALLTLLTLPAAVRAAAGLSRNPTELPQLIGSSARTIALHAISGLLLTLSYLAARVV